MQTTTLNLNELKKLVAEAKDLSQPFSYFLDITEKTDAVRTHKAIYQPEQHPVISLIIKIVENTLQQTINSTTPMFLAVPEHNFFHGTCQTVDNIFPITVIYFSDIQT